MTPTALIQGAINSAPQTNAMLVGHLINAGYSPEALYGEVNRICRELQGRGLITWHEAAGCWQTLGRREEVKA